MARKRRSHFKLLSSIPVVLWFSIAFLLLIQPQEIYPLQDTHSSDQKTVDFPLELKVRLPVRVVCNGTNSVSPLYSENLNKENFKVLISGQEMPVLDFVLKKRSIHDSEINRLFILSFDASEYSSFLAESVKYFVDHVLKSNDHLLIRSPIHTYQIDSHFSKVDIINYIEDVLMKDLLQWKESKADSLKELSQTLETVENKLDAKRIGMNSILLFINTYTHLWRKFDKQFLLSGLEQYPELASLSTQSQGDKWAIHFQERALLPMLNRYRRLAVRLSEHLNKLPKGNAKNMDLIRSTLEKIEQSMLFREDFPIQELSNVFLGVNINYNVIFFSGQKQGQNETSSLSIIPGYEQILMDIARKTGGQSVEIDIANSDTSQILEAIANHVDVYYDLAFSLGTEAGEKNVEIRILAPESFIAFYKNKFKSEELKWLKDWVVREISLDEVKLEGNHLSFTVNGFKMAKPSDKSPGKGLVKIEIRLIDDTNAVIYKTENTMQPLESNIKISLNLPNTINGYYKLNIIVQDLAANKNCEVNKYVKVYSK